MMNDYWIKYEKCPVCDSEIKRDVRSSSDSLKCHNGCFAETFLSAIYIYGYVFENKYRCDMRNDDSVRKYLNEMYAQVNYWKENDRYLIKILGGN